MKTRQLYDDTWVAVGSYEYDVCCQCGLTHRVFYRWNARKKRLEERWVVKPKFRRSILKRKR